MTDTQNDKKPSNVIVMDKLKLIIILALTVVITLVIATLMFSNVKYPNKVSDTNPLGNSVSSEDELSKIPELYISSEPETRTYESITTYTFAFTNSEGEPLAFANGRVDLEQLMTSINNFINGLTHKVKTIGIMGNILFIQVDERVEVEETQKCGIMTLKDYISVDEFTKISESIHHLVDVNCAVILKYSNTSGTNHLLYIYSDYTDLNVQDTNIVE